MCFSVREEPQDIDFRVGLQEPELPSPSMEISADQHTEILLQVGAVNMYANLKVNGTCLWSEDIGTTR